jgi:Na+-driven multidrug efflux pump
VSALLARSMGTAGIWLGIPVGWGVGFAASWAYYLTGRWKLKVVARPAGMAGAAAGSPERGEEAPR